MTDDDVFEVQRLYPQIYLACHTDHVRAASTKWRISSQDASILVHLDRDHGLSPRALAAHLGVKPSTLSAALSRLSEMGLSHERAWQVRSPQTRDSPDSARSRSDCVNVRARCRTRSCATQRTQPEGTKSSSARTLIARGGGTSSQGIAIVVTGAVR